MHHRAWRNRICPCLPTARQLRLRRVSNAILGRSWPGITTPRRSSCGSTATAMTTPSAGGVAGSGSTITTPPPRRRCPVSADGVRPASSCSNCGGLRFGTVASSRSGPAGRGPTLTARTGSASPCAGSAPRACRTSSRAWPPPAPTAWARSSWSFPPPLQDRAAVAVAARHLRSAPTGGRGPQPSRDRGAGPPASVSLPDGTGPLASASPPAGARPPASVDPASAGPPSGAGPSDGVGLSASASPPAGAGPPAGVDPAGAGVPASAGDGPSGPRAEAGAVQGRFTTPGRVRSETTLERPTDPRAASAVAALQRHLVEAARARARIAFVRSLLPLAEHARPAALVPLTCEVVPRREPPSISGRLLGRESWCHLRLGADWLVEVWGRGISVIDGHLVVAVNDDRRADLRVTVVRWKPAGGPDGVASRADQSPAVDDGPLVRPARRPDPCARPGPADPDTVRRLGAGLALRPAVSDDLGR